MIPLATVAALEQRLGRELLDEESGPAEAALDDASALVRLETGADWVEDGKITAPQAVITVTVQAALRALRNPEGFVSETVGEFTYRRADSTVSLYLTEHERAILRRAVGASGVWTMRTAADYREAEICTGFIDDSFGTEPFPYYSTCDP